MWLLLAFLVTSDSIPTRLMSTEYYPSSYSSEAKCVETGSIWSRKYEAIAKDSEWKQKRLVYDCLDMSKFPKHNSKGY